jgi:hypothetical protein
MENNISAQENLDYIKNVILDSKNIIKDNGAAAILWGIIIVIAQLSTFILIVTKIYSPIAWVWAAAIAIGWAVSLVISKKESKTGVVTKSLKIDSAIWSSALVVMPIIGFAGTFSGMISAFAINPLIALILGSSYYVTGVVYSDRIFKNISFGWWIGGTVLFWIKNEYSFLIFAAMMIVLQIVPGIMLYIKYKKEEAK